ncbi:MFS transporter [Streptacidiphilus carbonis]|uniref:MFS transporter n=1 Tax=Streptacidiphilus carbonis TaxID=105422 RepID=UPI000A91FA3F|nr:MFS transporter [Streptacidiphilus carbonis]
MALLLQVAWSVFLATNGGDMAAQYAWTQFAAVHPGSAYDLSWYGGMHPVSYSVIASYLMAWAGMRTTAVLAGTLSAALLARLLVRAGLRRPLLPALCGAAALAGNTMSGRATFGIGLCFGLAAVLAAYESRGSLLLRAAGAGLLGVLATLASPVAGLFLLVAAPALFLTGRRRLACALAAGPPLVVATTTLLFPFYGVQPYPWLQVSLVAGTALPIALLAPRAWRAVRIGAWTYSLGNVLTLAIPSPIGSNVERLSLMFAATVLLAAALNRRGRGSRLLWLAFALALGWQCVQPLLDLAVTVPAAGWTQYAEPLEGELLRLGADQGRVEVVGTGSHVEASSLAPTVELARGWNRQVDVARNPLFYDGTLTPASYRAWLDTWAVGFVVLPDTGLDYSSEAEGRIVEGGQPWLTPVWHDAHWQVFRVSDAVPLVPAPARVVHAGEAELTLRTTAAGSMTVRLIWSPWLALLDGGRGCLSQDGLWTRLTVASAGTFHIGSSYARAGEAPCTVAPALAARAPQHGGLR